MSVLSSALASKLHDLYPPAPSPASSACSACVSPVAAPTEAVTVAVSLSGLQSWAAQAFKTIADLIRPAPSPQLRSLFSSHSQLVHGAPTAPSTLSTLLTTPSTALIATLITLAAAVLAFLFLAPRSPMDGRRSFGWAGGPRSPFLSAWTDPQANLSNLSGHFEYIEPDEGIYNAPRPSTARSTYSAGEEHEDPSAPDQIHVLYMDHKFTIEFPPYAINEEKASVRELRRGVARGIGTSPDRVRLVYKGVELKRNRFSLRQYQMKQNSEVCAIVTDRARNYDRDSASDSDSDSGSRGTRSNPRRQQPQSVHEQRPRSISSVRHRSDEPFAPAQTNGNAFLSPTGHVPSTPPDRRPRDTLRPFEAAQQHHDSPRQSSRGPDYRDSNHRRERSTRRDREPSRSRGTSAARASLSTPQPPLADPNTPLGEVQGLLSTLHTVWLPQCTRFIAGPPSDRDARRKEYLKLSESVMQLVDKADAIELEGDTEARSLRKALINEANAVVKKLDAVGK
ncbi:hypothetical protein DV738_g1297, partial [Chaetothyriales sp. CBS 135597]